MSNRNPVDTKSSRGRWDNQHISQRPCFCLLFIHAETGIVPRLNYAPPSYSVPVCHASLFFTHKAHRILAMHTEEKQPLTIPNSIGRENSKMEGIW